MTSEQLQAAILPVLLAKPLDLYRIAEQHWTNRRSVSRGELRAQKAPAGQGDTSPRVPRLAADRLRAQISQRNPTALPTHMTLAQQSLPLSVASRVSLTPTSWNALMR